MSESFAEAEQTLQVLNFENGVMRFAAAGSRSIPYVSFRVGVPATVDEERAWREHGLLRYKAAQGTFARTATRSPQRSKRHSNRGRSRTSLDRGMEKHGAVARGWIEAAKKLAADRDAVVACPVCGEETLQVQDVPWTDRSHLDRHLVCSKCGGRNTITIRERGRRPGAP